MCLIQWMSQFSYLARQLLTQLRAVARRLSAGLDSDGMAAQLMVTMHEHLDDSYAAVFVKMRGSVLVPLGYRGMEARQLLLPNDPMVERCWADMEPCIGVVPSGNREARHRVVLPLRVGHRMIGVAVSSSARPVAEDELAALMREVEGHSLRLDTALVFDEIRTMATADERQRLAREIHDGIAQEIASLGLRRRPHGLDHPRPVRRPGTARPARRSCPASSRTCGCRSSTCAATSPPPTASVRPCRTTCGRSAPSRTSPCT